MDEYWNYFISVEFVNGETKEVNSVNLRNLFFIYKQHKSRIKTASITNNDGVCVFSDEDFKEIFN